MKQVMLVLLLLSSLYSKVEVIKISGELSSWTQKYFWPGLSVGSIHIDKDKIVIPDGNKLYIQSRSNPKDFMFKEYIIQDRTSFRIRSSINLGSSEVLLIFWDDGRYYLYKENSFTRKGGALIPKHGASGRLIMLPSGKIVSTGIYRPAYAMFLDKYDDESQGKETELAKMKFKHLMETNKAFTLAFFSKELELLDSANTIERVGRDAAAFDGLWTKHPVDVSPQGIIYLIDNDNGYVIERYEPPYRRPTYIRVNNKNFKPIPKNLTKETGMFYHKTSGSYTEAYALYLKTNLIIVSFYATAGGRDLPGPPYYYDIIDFNGTEIFSGMLDYPIIAEDEGDKIFIYVRSEGGWLEDEKYYLIGMTIKDIIDGKAQKATIDAEIALYEKELDND